MAEDLVFTTIVLKTATGVERVAYYLPRDEHERLGRDFMSGEYKGVYGAREAQSEQRQQVSLMLYFADVLYIG